MEMFGQDLVRSYEHAFTYIKQLAALLRGAMSSQSTDAYREIYCWQTVSTLELWCKLLAAHHDKEVYPLRVPCPHPTQLRRRPQRASNFAKVHAISDAMRAAEGHTTASGADRDEDTCKGGINSALVQELRPLVYPLCQIIVGAVKLKPTARYYTLHLRLLRSLIRLGGATRVLMPVVPMLLDMLKWAALSKRTSAAANPTQQGAFLLRANKAVLATSAFQADIVQQVPYPAHDAWQVSAAYWLWNLVCYDTFPGAVSPGSALIPNVAFFCKMPACAVNMWVMWQMMELLAAHFAQWACSMAFPEMAHLTLQQLRRFAKQCKAERLRTPTKALVAAMESNIAYVAAQRAASSALAPKDTASVLSFLASDDNEQKVLSPLLICTCALSSINTVSNRLLASLLTQIVEALTWQIHTIQAPLQVFARTLATKAQQQRTMQITDKVQADAELDSGEDEGAGVDGVAAAGVPADAAEKLAASDHPLAKKKLKAAPAPVPVHKVSSACMSP